MSMTAPSANKPSAFGLRKIRSSTKIGVGFVLVVGLGWLAFNKVQDFMIMGQHFAPISPKRINIVGITPNGYKVIIANEVAQLVQTQGDFQAGDQSENDESGGDSGGSVKKKISVKDMMGTLQGDSKALSSFLMSMNDLNENDLPPIRVMWTKEDITKALNGDPATRARLEGNLNMKLDGTPLSTLNIKSVENGIVLDVPVKLNVLVDGAPKSVVGDMFIAYKPRMIKAVENDIAQDQGKITDSVITGYYKEEAEKVLGKPASKENIAQLLKDQYSDQTARGYAEYPERILSTAFVVVNDSFMDRAYYTTYTSNNGKPLYDLHIDLNNEGRRRLWQYSRRRVGDQILLTSDGVAIAAARIQHSLMGGDITITHMTDQGLLDDLIANLKSAKGEKVAAQ